MLYFYLWVVFLLSLIFAVPIVSFVEKSRARKAAGPAPVMESAAVDEGEADDEASAEAAVADDGMAEFGEAAPADADDFSAFEDFK